MQNQMTYRVLKESTLLQTKRYKNQIITPLTILPDYKDVASHVLIEAPEILCSCPL